MSTTGEGQIVNRWVPKYVAPLSAVIFIGSLAWAVGVGSAGAEPQSKLACHASMTNSQPSDYTTTDVLVSTVARAAVTTTAHYKTKNTTHHATANGSGKATVPYYISGATPGYKVIVRISVKSGSKSGSCSTSFTPKK